jgi:putative DNA primase/helicase
VKTASLAADSLRPLSRQAITKLTARRLRSHSQGAGRVSSRSLMAKMTCLSGVAIDYLDCTDSAFARAVGLRWLISAVARIFRPGCQADHLLLLEGPQGIRKSSALRALVGDEWFTDHIADLGSKDSRLDLLGKWVIEMSELVSMRRAEIEKVKAFLTARTDHFRPPYGRRAVDVPRQNVFAASTNEEQPFVESSGNRSPPGEIGVFSNP